VLISEYQTNRIYLCFTSFTPYRAPSRLHLITPIKAYTKPRSP